MLSKLGILLKLIVAIFILGSDDSVAATKPQCQRKCGNVSIPYPFGIGEHCCINAWFEITCQNHIPVLQVYQMKVLNISVSQIRVANNRKFTDCNPDKESWTNRHIELLIKRDLNPFFFPHTSNKLVAVGCDIYSFITEANEENHETGCLSLCKGPISESAARFCSGFHCCQTPLTRNFRSFRVQILNCFPC
ncbi:wall-associated receptor kinase-like 1 [Pistacia vera]|uniref:wall-associated receptor kinase-like 1 n=1 Tax=Pistacia vera TaxID=55513 RepID=UPI0012633BFF|nr:wall-associated receptor kinase-like 1 [Pistacia vera]